MISDIIESLPAGAARLTELGKIKIGGLGAERPTQSGGKFRLPEKHDHFTITTLHRAPNKDLLPDTRLMETLVAQFGDTDKKLRQLPIRVLSNEIDDVLQASFVWYGGKTVAARSDGKEVTWFVDPVPDKRDGKFKRLREPHVEPWKAEFLEYVDQRGNKLFKLHAVLNCVIASKESRWGGVYKFRTTSQITFRQLYASLLHIHQLTGGVLVGMPLMLVIRPIQVAPDGKATTVYVVHAELRGAELVDIQRQALQQSQWMLENRQKLLVVQQQYRKLLVAPGDESKLEAEDIAAEFQPESQTLEAAPANYDLIDGETTETAAPEQNGATAGEDRGEGEPPQDNGEAPASDENEPTVDAPPDELEQPAPPVGENLIGDDEPAADATGEPEEQDAEPPPAAMQVPLAEFKTFAKFKKKAAALGESCGRVPAGTTESALKKWLTATSYVGMDDHKGLDARRAFLAAVIEDRLNYETGEIRVAAATVPA